MITAGDTLQLRAVYMVLFYNNLLSYEGNYDLPTIVEQVYYTFLLLNNFKALKFCDIAFVRIIESGMCHETI